MNRVPQRFGFLILSCLLACLPVGTQAQPCLQLLWVDEFDGNTLDTARWSYEIGNGCPDLCGFGNNEQQYYSDAPENIRVENGHLIITAREDSLGLEDYSSAKIFSKGKADFRYGRFEARMKFPTTQGLWPAFWMLPTEQAYGGWPESGEIDIVEMIGKKPGQAVGTLHTGLPHTFISGYYDLPPGEILADTFHVFAIEWEPDSITWFLDGIQYHQLTPNDISPWAPFQEDFYLILNLALGGPWSGNVDATTVLPQTLEVDYVRVYNRPERFPIDGVQPFAGAVGLEYSTADVPGASYIWTVPLDVTITSGQGSPQITVDWECTPGNISLELQTVCDTAILTYDVSGFVVPTITGARTVNGNQTNLSYALSQEGTGTYAWEVPPSATIVSGQGSNQIVVDWGCDPGDIILTFNSSCGDIINDTLPVALQIYAISGQPSIPPNIPNRTYSMSEIPGATYTWSVSGDASIVAGQGSPGIQVDFGTTSGVISVAVGTSCGTKTYDFPFVVEESFVYADFDERTLPFNAHNGAVLVEVANPSPSGINTSARVGRVNKTPGSRYWAGVEAIVQEIPLDLRPVMTQKVYSGTTGVVRFMLDDLTKGKEKLKIGLDYGPENVNQWVQLVYDFTGAPADVYDEIGLTYNHYMTTTEFWYFDDVMAWPDASGLTSLEAGITELITVYPNPFSGQFSVDTKDIFPMGSTYELEVMDMQGRSVLRQQVTADGQPVALDLSDRSTGLYFLRLSGQSLHYLKAIEKKD